MKKLGLIGFPLGHSFSKKYYLEKFEKEHIRGIDYNLYPLEDIHQFPDLYQETDGLYGVNVTIPHKQTIIPFLNELSPEAQQMNAVNCIQIKKNGEGYHLKGFNTDAFGFEESLKPLLKPHHSKALILGNGGAAQAVVFSLEKLDIPYQFVSRTKTDTNLTYTELNDTIIKEHTLIINCSPLGTYPNVDTCPDIPYESISKEHLLYDLVYNPEVTLFLKKGQEQGAEIKNGYEMLLLQAERNWVIWNEV
ncbi:shikimate dehydrogenase family protein [Sphingobacterium spiritivorum]|uniref:Shikimate dehydrogenase n=1 Tax=Sphingobacterium spiritivorum ATCC 33861 TaxID=525373 RepID=D7VLQ5_SPHSI|nr:shikimate dehydrogenase [Sphingobacterium spiritivorum]EFK58528.1 putative shikimate dehydrogenase [Sphingobacterium spiritivorum ATCC 33861]QQT37262.1 shikimate dehydrogenase [Sphingobacterium spiritivorum]WQD34044.1 shikimate dehydrogenase [Sphingobacterium spiritivorum]SUJ29313.1 Shikimate dehydrogenase [Sphingobacterium spiritivorum]